MGVVWPGQAMHTGTGRQLVIMGVVCRDMAPYTGNPAGSS
jgi:hypothetical protein